MKRVLIGILIFSVYLTLVIVAAFAFHFEDEKLVLFIAILGLVGAFTTAFVLWYLYMVSNRHAQSMGSETPDAVNLNNLLRDADARVRQSGRAGAKSLASLPLIYVVGDENSAKTQTVLQSGLEPELLAGHVYQDGIVVPTQLANVWLAGNYVIAEAGGTLLRQPPLWQRLVRATIPARLGSVFGDSRLPARSVVVCVSVERIMAPNTAEQIRALAQILNERLRQLSQTLGISLPIYVLFTKLDTVAPFADYAGKLTEEEVKLPIGSLLPSLSTGSGLYTEQATALIGGRFDQMLFAFAEFRLDVLFRGGDFQVLARAYEFPRDLRKLRTGIVSFLAEVARPSQIGVNPFLRGFFFTGIRAHIVEDILDIGPAQPHVAAPIEARATRIFSLAAMQEQQAAPPPRRGGTRKVPQWVFLPHLFSKILLADKSALESSLASTRTSVLKRMLLACANAVILIVLVFTTISFFNNRSLKKRVAAAAVAPVSSVAQGSYASQGDLESLEKLHVVLAELERYRKNGSPFMYRLGLYRGDALYSVACQTYANKVRTLLLAPAQSNMLAKFGALQSPPAADADYGATYRPLKTYLITASNPDPDTAQDTVDFLPNALLTEWTGNGTPTPDVAHLAQTQFEFYASLLPGSTSCLAGAGSPRSEPQVAKARYYLNGFRGFQHVYQSMLAAANRKVPGFNYNARFPGSSQYFIDTYPVQGAFTRDGFTFMLDAILHPDQYFRGEEWVLGPSSGPSIDRAALSAQLKQVYTAEYIQTWRTYLAKAQFIGYKSFPDAGAKLGALDSNTSALLELFSLISTNTAVPNTEISNSFQAPQSVVAPSTSPDARLIGPANLAYIQALQALEGAVQGMAVNPTSANDPKAAAPVAQAAVTAEGAAETLRNQFVPDPTGGMDKISFKLLEEPIKSTKELAAEAPLRGADSAAEQFCSQIAPLLSKFPFNPQSPIDATSNEVAKVFAPGTGSFATYNSSLKTLVVQEGSNFHSVADSGPPVSRAFLKFLNDAATISSTLFPTGGNEPSLYFTLTEIKSPGVPDAVLNIDEQQITGAGQKVSFHWVSKPDSKYSISSNGNSSAPKAGPWSVFHFGFNATHLTPNRLKFSLQMNNETNGVVQFDLSGPGAPLLNPVFMNRFRCVPRMFR